jgi:antitoxin VapB
MSRRDNLHFALRRTLEKDGWIEIGGCLMSSPNHVFLVASGQNQVLTIPSEFTLPSSEVLLRKEGNRLIIEPIQPGSLLALLSTLEDIADPFPDTDEETLSLDDIVL